jgi:uncharacterized protein (TIGR03083 family)
VDAIGYRSVVDAESRRFLDVLEHVDLGADVPSCPDWRVADLLWHLAEVHGFWAQIAGRLLQDPSEADDLERPPDAALRAYASSRRDELLDALARRSPTDRCWSWSDLGDDVAWVARRQAHEALIHRVDAELAAGVAVSTCDAALAVDGVDELLRGFVVGVPAWATWTPEGTSVALDCTDVGRRFVVELGRMTGSSPDSGRRYDLDAAELLEDHAATADVEVSGDAWDVDLWLWGRGQLEDLTVSGAPPVLEPFRALVTEATQ